MRRLGLRHLVVLGLAAGTSGSVVAAVLGGRLLAWVLLTVVVGSTGVLVVVQQHQLSRRIGHSRVLLERALKTAVEQRKAPKAGGSAASSVVDHPDRDGWALTASQWWARDLRAEPHRIGKFVFLAKKTDSEGALDVLALLASSGAYHFRSLRERLSGAADPRSRRMLEDPSVTWWVPGLLALARAVVTRPTRLPGARRLAYQLYALTVSLEKERVLKPIDRSFYGDLLLDQGWRDDSFRVLNRSTQDSERQLNHYLLACNAVNPAFGGSAREWLERLGQMYARHGLAPLELDTADGRLFDRVRCVPAVPVDGPLVTVIMPVYEPTDETDVAIRSVLDQTWRNIELIIVDDGSPRTLEDGTSTGHLERLEQWAGRDSRIRLILNDVNRGAYWARNTGYEAARGEFVTVADKDDWHHCQQIEVQVRCLTGDDAPVACLTNWARVDERLRFLLRWGPDRVVHPSFASLMFRREEVQARLGYWDVVRKGGDGEFISRLKRAFGISLEPVLPVPMAFSYLGEGNLTSLDVGMGYESASRAMYKQSYRGWHESLSSAASYYLPLAPDPRPFAAPDDFLPEGRDVGKVDVLYVADFSDAVRAAMVAAELRSSVLAGLRAAVVPAVDLVEGQLSTHSVVDELVNEGWVERVAVSEPVEVDRVIVRGPRTFHVDQFHQSRIKAREVIVVADQAPFSELDGRRAYDPMVVAMNLYDVFGALPRWAWEDRSVYDKLRCAVDEGSLDDRPWEGPTEAGTPGSGSPDDRLMHEVGASL
ncbi:MAG: glycosyltransferase [Cellulomonas sp.]|nr:glycosyltransferase [Cellulomonas sp.]